ncbi:hypothetical protein, partial [Paenibacillus chibensis]
PVFMLGVFFMGIISLYHKLLQLKCIKISYNLEFHRDTYRRGMVVDNEKHKEFNIHNSVMLLLNDFFY